MDIGTYSSYLIDPWIVVVSGYLILTFVRRIVPINMSRAHTVYSLIFIFGSLSVSLSSIFSGYFFTSADTSRMHSIVYPIFALIIIPLIVHLVLRIKCIKSFIKNFLINSEVQLLESAWLAAFYDSDPGYISVQLKNGEVVNGYWKKPAVASSYYLEHDLYIDEVLDENFGEYEPINKKFGVFISADSIFYAKIFNKKGGKNV